MLTILITQIAAAACVRVPADEPTLADALASLPPLSRSPCVEVWENDFSTTPVRLPPGVTVTGHGATRPWIPPVILDQFSASVRNVQLLCQPGAPSVQIGRTASATLEDVALTAIRSQLLACGDDTSPWVRVEGDLTWIRGGTSLATGIRERIFEVPQTGALTLEQVPVTAGPGQTYAYVQGSMFVRGGTARVTDATCVVHAVDGHVWLEESPDWTQVDVVDTILRGEDGSAFTIDGLRLTNHRGPVAALVGSDLTLTASALLGGLTARPWISIADAGSFTASSTSFGGDGASLVQADHAARVKLEGSDVYGWTGTGALFASIATPTELSFVTVDDADLGGAVVSAHDSTADVTDLSVTEVSAQSIVSANADATIDGLYAANAETLSAPIIALPGATVTVSDATFTDVRTSGASIAHVDQANLTLRNVVRDTFYAGARLAALVVSGGIVDARDLVLRDATAVLDATDSQTTLTNVTFEQQSGALPPFDVRGGTFTLSGFEGVPMLLVPTLIELNDASALIRDLHLDDLRTRAAPYVRAEDSDVVLEDSVLSRGGPSIPGEEVSGGILVDHGSLTVRRSSLVRGPSARPTLAVHDGSLTMEQVTLYGSATATDAAILASDADVQLTDLSIFASRRGEIGLEVASGLALACEQCNVVARRMSLTDMNADRGDLISLIGGTSSIEDLSALRVGATGGAIVRYTTGQHTGARWDLQHLSTLAGAIVSDAPSAEIPEVYLSDLRIWNAHADEGAGAITVRGGHVDVTRLDACGNTGALGGHVAVSPLIGAHEPVSVALRASTLALTPSPHAVRSTGDRSTASLDHVTVIGAAEALLYAELGRFALHDTILADAPVGISGAGSIVADYSYFWADEGGGPLWDGLVEIAGTQILPIDPWFRAYRGRHASTCDSIDLRLSARSGARDYGDPEVVDADGSRADVGGTAGPDWPRADTDGDGWDDDADCAPDDPMNGPQSDEIPYDGLDQDCDGTDLFDQDGDGWPGGSWAIDCDDLNPEAHPGAEERWYDDEDQACDGGDDHDADLDGWPAPGDCDDANDRVNPGAVDRPGDGVDANCDGLSEVFAEDEVVRVATVKPWGCATSAGVSPALGWLLFAALRRRPRQNHTSDQHVHVRP